jgi:hypothetical protein
MASSTSRPFFAQSTPWMGAISGGEYGDPKTQADLLRRLSPIHKLERVQAAMLVMHGANDTNVPVVEARQVVDTLKKNGRDVEFLLFPDEGSRLAQDPNRVKSTTTLAEFFVDIWWNRVGRPPCDAPDADRQHRDDQQHDERVGELSRSLARSGRRGRSPAAA